MIKKIAGVAVSIAPLSAFAAVPAAVDTALGGIQADATAVATTMLVVVAALAVFAFMRRQIH